MKLTKNTIHNRGGSLVEVLVVIVVFLVGILALVQIFPTGLGILRTTKNNTVADNLARAEVERIQANGVLAPELIAPVRFNLTSNGLQTTIDPNLSPRDLMPPLDGATGRIDASGNVLVGGNPIGHWGRLSGANRFSRVIGEGGSVSAPRLVGTENVSLFTPLFAPMLYSRDSGTGVGIPGLVSLYSNDLQAAEGDRQRGFPGGGRADEWRWFFVDASDVVPGEGVDDGDQIWIGPATRRLLRISLTFSYETGGGGGAQYSTIVPVDLDPALVGSSGYFATIVDGYWCISVAALVSQPDVFGNASPYDPFFVRGAIPDSIRVQRQYREIPLSVAFSDPSVQSERPFLYRVPGEGLGAIQIDPQSFNYRIPRGRGGRVPLQARVDYTVLDWRIIRDDFRISRNEPFNQKLMVESLKVGGNSLPDGTPYPGLGVTVPMPGTEPLQSDVVLYDVETGGVLLGNQAGHANNGYTVDKSFGVLEFRDVDGDSTNGLSLYVSVPTTTGWSAPVLLPDVRGRAVRALYQARGELAVHMLKAARVYNVLGAYSASTGIPIGGAFVGGTTGVGDPYRLYFPRADIGQKVMIGEIWFNRGAGPEVIYDQEFQISAVPGENFGAIDIRDRIAGNTAGVAFDFSNGYAVRRVRGASVTVQVLWNDASFNLGTDPEQNFRNYEAWTRTLRRNQTTAFFVGGTQ